MSDNQDNSFFIQKKVGKRGDTLIETRFDTLIKANCERPFDWYKDKSLELDKSDASKIRRGIIIPPIWLQIKIAQYFKTDSATIWNPNMTKHDLELNDEKEEE